MNKKICVYLFLSAICIYTYGQPAVNKVTGSNDFIKSIPVSNSEEYLKNKASIDSILQPALKKINLLYGLDSEAIAHFDKLITFDKNVFVVKIHNITFSEVRFTYPFNLQLNSINRTDVSQILYRNGKIDVFTPLEDRNVNQKELVDSSKLIVKSAKDWARVTVTENSDDVSNLAEKGKLQVRYEADIENASNDYLMKNATIILKKKAAALKAHYVLIDTKFFHKGYGDLPSVEINALAYGF